MVQLLKMQKELERREGGEITLEEKYDNPIDALLEENPPDKVTGKSGWTYHDRAFFLLRELQDAVVVRVGQVEGAAVADDGRDLRVLPRHAALAPREAQRLAADAKLVQPVVARVADEQQRWAAGWLVHGETERPPEPSGLPR